MEFSFCVLVTVVKSLQSSCLATIVGIYRQSFEMDPGAMRLLQAFKI
jgi:hypothetical protein